ncbi:hypothetical protein [uncultured Ruminococcus sp.]|uniref:hypothetical protein n=1 Tax=uncultured Ruminococcus sp. TaxID=165186 RepID=UPI0025F5F933|nr:hypothetical protein [uncultured Ruminococcus sp.]
MKVPFTPFQIILTSLNAAALSLCVGGDVFVLLFDRGAVSGKVIVTNLVMSVLVIILSSVFVFRTEHIDTFSRVQKDDEDKLPAIRALRTYFCMLTLDFAGVLSLMLAGALFYKNAGKAIIIFAPAVFVLSAIIYFVRVSRIGLVDYSDDNDDPFSDDL